MSDLATKLRLLKALGPGATQMNQVDIARSVVPGNSHPMFAGAAPNDLAQFDRLAWGQEMQQHFGKIPAVLSGALVGGGYEALKAAQQYLPREAPLGKIAGLLLKGAGSSVGGDASSYMKTDKTTSDASLKNVLALLYGASH